MSPQTAEGRLYHSKMSELWTGSSFPFTYFVLDAGSQMPSAKWQLKKQVSLVSYESILIATSAQQAKKRIPLSLKQRNTFPSNGGF